MNHIKRQAAKAQNLRFYYTGEPCSRGHIEERFVSSKKCKQCALEDNQKWRSNNRDKFNDYHRDYYDLKPYRKIKAVRQATPNWIDQNELEGALNESKRYTKEYGMKFVVDHIVPIKNKNVCGLNVPWNLHLITISVKNKKGNKFNSVKESNDYIKYLRAKGLAI